MADDDENELEESEEDDSEEEFEDDDDDGEWEDDESDDDDGEWEDDDDESDDAGSDDDDDASDDNAEEAADDAEEASDDGEEASDDADAGSDESDDEPSDDEPAAESSDSDDDDDDDDDEPAAEPKARVRGKTGKRQAKQKSAAARLAAARAAKAARKAAKRGKERQDEKAPLEVISESKLAKQAQKAGDWASNNRPTVYAIAAVLVAALVGGIGYYSYQLNQAEAGGALLAEAVEMGNAPIRSEDAEPEEDDPLSYTSVTERAEAALAGYERVVSDHGDTPAAAWAQLGRGDALLELDRAEEARGAFEAAIQAGGTDAAVVWRALEGKGFTHEAEEEWEQALEVYQELSRLDEGRFEPVAKYHIARMYISQGQEEEATETLSALVEELREAADDEERQEFSYVLAQAEVRLRELDPSSVPARPTLGGAPGAGPPGGPGGPLGGAGGPLGGAGGVGDLSPEQLQQLIQSLQSKQGGAPPGVPPLGQ